MCDQSIRFSNFPFSNFLLLTAAEIVVTRRRDGEPIGTIDFHYRLLTSVFAVNASRSFRHFAGTGPMHDHRLGIAICARRPRHVDRRFRVRATDPSIVDFFILYSVVFQIDRSSSDHASFIFDSGIRSGTSVSTAPAQGLPMQSRIPGTRDPLCR